MCQDREQYNYLMREIERLRSMRLGVGCVVFQGEKHHIRISFEEGPDGPHVEACEVKNGMLHMLPRIYNPVKPKKTKGRK